MATASFITKHAGTNPVFIGFDVEEFFRFIGLECARSEYSTRCTIPVSAMYGTPSFVDMYDCLGVESASESAAAFSCFSEGFTGEDLEKYTTLVKGWTPHKDAERDARLAFLFGTLFSLWGNTPVSFDGR